MNSISESAIECLARHCNKNEIRELSKAIPNFQIILSSLKMKERQEKIGWQVGDIVWANVTGYRFWPALIANTPQPNENQMHCVFLHSNGQTAKVGRKNCVVAFNGLDDFRIKCQTIGRQNKSYKTTPNNRWSIAILEANALEYIHGSARLAFYQAVFLPAFQSSTFDTEPLDNNNNVAFNSKLLNCPLIIAIQRLADYSLFRPFILNERKFGKILQQVHSETCKIARNHKQVTKVVRIKEETTNINQRSIKTEPNQGDFKLKIKMETDEKKRKRNDKIIRKCQISSADELFEYVSKRRVCETCLTSGIVRKCAGECNGVFHKACIGNAGICQNCDETRSTCCFACGKYGNDPVVNKCGVKNCEYSFHMDCLARWPQSHCSSSSATPKMFCPRHVCHTCVSSNIQDLKHSIQPNKDLLHCIRCPTTYHRDSACIPAGTTIISSSQIQCIRHQTERKPDRFSHCALCARSGALKSCQSCPLSYHKNCVDNDGGPLTCTRCMSGRLPLYGEIVWVKYAHFAWWPAIIVSTPAIPHNVYMKRTLPMSFCVYFFGSHNYGWVVTSQVHPYEFDGAKFTPRKPTKDLAEAVAEANEYYSHLKTPSIPNEISPLSSLHLIKPEPYIRIQQSRIPQHLMQSIKSDEILEYCDCKDSHESPCGIESDCLNQLFTIECDEQTCKMGGRCQNRCFQNGAKIPVEIKMTPLNGFGAFAKQRIPHSSLIVEYVGEIIDRKESEDRTQHTTAERGHFYMIELKNNIHIDSKYYGNESRFINHSCEPNAQSARWSVGGQYRIGIFATRDINIDEEITMDYCWKTSTSCNCRASSCRGFI